jgi:NAD(P)H dehydrogenase (quinone)
MNKSSEKKKKVMIIFYSVYGQVETLARQVAEGVNSVEGVQAEIWRVQETEKIIHSDEFPVITHDRVEELTNADGFLFGVTCQGGMMPNQFKSFWDMTGGLWAKGGLVGKSAGVFFSSNNQGGGQETTAMTMVTQFTHHGIAFVPIGYSYGKDLFGVDELKAGSPWGAGTFTANDESREPSDLELKIAKHQGQYFANYLKRIKE